MRTTTITLSSPIELHGKRITQIELKEPNGLQFLQIGDPRIVTRTSSGDHIFIEDRTAIAEYLDRCIQHEHGSHLMAAMSLVDAQKVKAALYDFFAQPEPATSG